MGASVTPQCWWEALDVARGKGGVAAQRVLSPSRATGGGRPTLPRSLAPVFPRLVRGAPGCCLRLPSRPLSLSFASAMERTAMERPAVRRRCSRSERPPRGPAPGSGPDAPRAAPTRRFRQGADGRLTRGARDHDGGARRQLRGHAWVDASRVAAALLGPVRGERATASPAGSPPPPLERRTLSGEPRARPCPRWRRLG